MIPLVAACLIGRVVCTCGGDALASTSIAFTETAGHSASTEPHTCCHHGEPERTGRHHAATCPHCHRAQLNAPAATKLAPPVLRVDWASPTPAAVLPSVGGVLANPSHARIHGPPSPSERSCVLRL